MKRGFTLIEIVVVVVLVFALLALALPSWLGYRLDGSIDVVRSDLALIQNALDDYYARMQRYPVDRNDYQTELIQETTVLKGYYQDPFLKELHYYYQSFENARGNKYYVVISPGPNRVYDIDLSEDSQNVRLEEGVLVVPFKSDDIVVTNFVQRAS